MSFSPGVGRAVRTPGAILLFTLGWVAGCDDATSPPLASEIFVVGGAGQMGEVAKPLPQPIAFQVNDAQGRPISGAAVTFAVAEGGGSVDPESATTGPQGKAQTIWTLGPLSSSAQRVAATADGVSDQVTAVARPGPASVLEIIGGAEQAGPAGAALPDSLAVRVLDAYGNSVAGAVVTWTVQEGGGAILPVQVNAGSDGTARARWTLGGSAGPNAAQAGVGFGTLAHFQAVGFPAAVIAGTISISGGLLSPPAAAAAGLFTTGSPVFAGASAADPGAVGAATRLSGGTAVTNVPAGGPSTAPGASPSGGSLPADSVPGQWVLQLHAGAIPGAPTTPRGVSGSAATAMSREIRSMMATHAAVSSARATVTGVSPVLRAVRVQVASGENEVDVVASLRADPRVERVEPLRLVTSHGSAIGPTSPLLDGLFYPRQSWHYGMIRLPGGWEVSEGSSTVLVAVIDDGIRYDHQAFAANLTSDGYDFVRELEEPLPHCGGGTITNTGDGDGPDPDPTIPASYSFNPSFLCWSTNEFGGHGLHVAGTIAASAAGVTGVAPNVRIRPIRVLGTTGLGTTYDVAQGVLYAAGLPADDGAGGLVEVAMGAHILNLSLGSAVDDPVLGLAISQAAAAGTLIIASAGNSGSTELTYPAAYPETISVSALGPNFLIAPYSARGSTIDLAAPGGNMIFGPFAGGVWSTIWNFDTNESFIGASNGTSMAAPHVSGVAALLLSHNPGMTAAQIRDRLFQTARDHGGPGKDPLYGYGLVDALLALTNGVGHPSSLRASLYDAVTGERVAEVLAQPDQTFQFSELDDGDYLVYAGRDDRHDGVTGQPGLAWGARGGSAQPAPISIEGAGIQDGSLTVGFPVEVEPNDAVATANTLPVGGYSYGTIGALSDQDHYRVLIGASGSYTFETGGVTGMCGFGLEVNTRIDLLNEQGLAIATNDDIDEPTERYCSRIVAPLAPGTYILRVRGTLGSTGGYTVRVY